MTGVVNYLLYQIVVGAREALWSEQKEKLGRVPLSLSYPIPEARCETQEEWLENRHKYSPTARFSPGVHPRVDGIPDEVSSKLIALDRFYWYSQKKTSHEGRS